MFKDDSGYTDTRMIHALKPLRKSISQFAIRRIKTELYHCWNPDEEEGGTEDTECDCEHRVNYLLPCRHMLPRDQSAQVQIDMVNCRWHLEKHNGKLYIGHVMNHCLYVYVYNV